MAPNGETHYINTRLRYDVTTNPVEPRFKTLVSLIKESKVNNTPLDEVTVLELLDPIERAADVKEMAEYQVSQSFLMEFSVFCFLRYVTVVRNQ